MKRTIDVLQQDPYLPYPGQEKWDEMLTIRIYELWSDLARTVNGDAVWDTIVIPAQSIYASGAGIPTWGGICWSFPDASTTTLGGTTVLTHGWAEGTDIIPQIRWYKEASSSGAVGWEFSYSIADISGTFASMSAFASGTLQYSDSDTANKHAVTRFAAITNTAKIGAAIKWQVRRVGGTDAYNGAASLMAVVFHIQENSDGSVSEYTK